MPVPGAQGKPWTTIVYEIELHRRFSKPFFKANHLEMTCRCCIFPDKTLTSLILLKSSVFSWIMRFSMIVQSDATWGWLCEITPSHNIRRPGMYIVWCDMFHDAQIQTSWILYNMLQDKIMSPQQNFLAKQKKKKKTGISHKENCHYSMPCFMSVQHVPYCMPWSLRVTSSTDKTADLG